MANRTIVVPADPAKPAPYKPVQAPIGIHEQLIGRLHKRDRVAGTVIPDAVLSTMEGAVKATREATERLASLHGTIMADRTKAPAERRRLIASATDTVSASAAKRLDAARKSATDEIAKVEASIAAPARPGGATDSLETEIRGALARMPAPDRRETIATAINAGDAATIRAVLTGPAFLSGLTASEVAAHRATWRRLAHPDAVDRLDRIGHAVAAIDRCGVMLIDFVATVADGGDTAAAMHERTAKEIDEAIEAARATDAA